MNNLFRITKNNLDNVFDYNIINTKPDNKINKHKLTSKDKKIKNINFNNNTSISYKQANNQQANNQQVNNQQVNTNLPVAELVVINNFNCDKVKNNDDTHTHTFLFGKDKKNVELCKDNKIFSFYKTDNSTNIFNNKEVRSYKQIEPIKKIQHEINNNFNNINKLETKENIKDVKEKYNEKYKNKEDSGKKIIWEFGKSNIKVEKLKKYQGFKYTNLLFSISNTFTYFSLNVIKFWSNKTWYFI